VSKPYGVLRCCLAASIAMLAASLMTVPPVRAADETPAPKPAETSAQQPKKLKKPKAQPVATTTAAKPAPAKEKPAKTPKPAPTPEKSYAEQRAEDGPWAKRTNWLSLRAGYAKSRAENAGDGLGGYGIAYQRMLTRKYAFGMAVQHDVLGHLSNSYEVSVPFTAEFTRHFRWATAFHPYAGLGGGYYFHKYYRTGSDYTGAPGGGWYVNVGGNMPVDDKHLIGIDTRVSFVKGRTGVINPVFGPEKANETLWSIKLNWAMAY